MSKNIVNDIAQIYTQISESSRLETDMQKRRQNNEKAIRDMKNTKAHKDMVAAVRKKFDEDAKPDYLDFDGDGNEKESMKKALKDKTKKKVEEANDGNLANNYPPYDKVTRGDVIAGRLGKDQMGGKKKPVKEGFSNWREDLREVVDEVDKKEKSKEIKEKKVKNKIAINPDMKESVEEIGGVLIEMIEMDELDGLVESVYEELFDEGYEEDDIEEAIEYALTEAKVTYGHNTPSPEKKKQGLLDAARERLSSAKASAKAAVARGARKVAKGALGVARKMEGGDKKPHSKSPGARPVRAPQRPPSAAGQKEKVSSGSYKAPEKPKAEPVSDPWEGSYKKSSEVKAPKTKKVATPKPKVKTAAKKKKSNLDNLLQSIRNEEVHLDERALSRAQQRFMGMVYAAKKGETPASPEVAKVAAGMSKKEARKFAKTKHEGLPEKKVNEDIAAAMSPQELQARKQQVQTDIKVANARKQAISQMKKQPVVKPADQQMVTKEAADTWNPKTDDPTLAKALGELGEEMVSELNRYEKETGKDLKTGKSVVKGGTMGGNDTQSKVMRHMHSVMGAGRMGAGGSIQKRGEKKQKGAPTPGPSITPAQKVAKRRAQKQAAQDAMHSRFD